jgi:hypothetical protein
MDRKYPINRAERIVTRYTPVVLLSIKDKPYNIVKFFMPKRYSTVFNSEDIKSINSQKDALRLVYNELCDKSNLYTLSTEQ